MKKFFPLLAIVLLFLSYNERPSDRTIALLLLDGNINLKWNTGGYSLLHDVTTCGYNQFVHNRSRL